MKQQLCIKEYVRYVSLNVLGMIGLSCYILADTFFVAQGLGAEGLAALNLALPVYNLIYGCGMMLGIGGAMRYTIFRSQKKEKQSSQVFTHTLQLAVICSVLFMLTGFFGAEPIATLLGAGDSGKVFEMSHTYLKMLLIFSPLYMTNSILLCFVRNDGAPQLTMFAMLACNFTNIILDYIFIFPMKMGMLGAVLATAVAPIASLLTMASFFIKKRNHFHVVKTRVCLENCRYILPGGIPTLITEVSSGIVMFVFNTITLQLCGNTGVAAYGVVANLALVVISVYTGIAQGIQPLISKYYGLKQKHRMSEIFRYAVITVVILSGIMYIFLFVNAEMLTSVFNSEGDRKLQSIAVYGMKLYFTACMFAGFNIILSVYFAARDCVKPANLISILRGFVIIIPMVYGLSYVAGMTGMWLSFPATEIIVAILGVVILIIQNR